MVQFFSVVARSRSYASPTVFWPHLATSLPPHSGCGCTPPSNSRRALYVLTTCNFHHDISTNSSAKIAFCPVRGFTDCTLLFLLQLMIVFIAGLLSCLTSGGHLVLLSLLLSTNLTYINGKEALVCQVYLDIPHMANPSSSTSRYTVPSWQHGQAPSSSDHSVESVITSQLHTANWP